MPDLDWTRGWTDEELYEQFGLTEAEIAVIEAKIKEMATPVTAAV